MKSEKMFVLAILSLLIVVKNRLKKTIRVTRMRRITGHLIMSLAVLTLFSGGETQADILSFSFTDPVGDHSGVVDLVSVTVTFDNTTGDYEVLLTADAANPFNGNFRINLNLFNPE